MTAEGTESRRAAYLVLADVTDGAYADRAAARHFASLSPLDRRLAQELAFGAIRLRARLDAELARLTNRPLSRLDPPVLDALRLGLYQLRETRIPAHAAVNATLNAVRPSMSAGARGLVNAILRRAGREGPPPDLFPTLEADPVAHLAGWGSHPEWLIRRWLQRYPLATVQRLVENNNRPPPVTYRLIDASFSGADAARLDDVGLAPLPGRPAMAQLSGATPAESVRAGLAVVQDPAASAVVDYMSIGIEGPVLDVCAAPGGKSVGLWHASAARPVVSADVSASRLRRVAELAVGSDAGLCLAVMDGRAPAVRSARTVVLDVPCSGTGVLRRRADARWRLREERIGDLVALQRELLEGGAGILEPGGLLVYATCSLEPEENEAQVERFLADHPEFERDSEGPTGGGDLHVVPWEEDSDGAYASRLRKGRRER